LGILHIGPLAERADAALERLAAYLTMLSEHQPAFRIRAESVTDPLADAVSATPSSQWASTGRSQPRQRRPATAEIASVALG
jgi:fructoselysine-6-P-deglycase FrlB-like protein